MRLHYHHICSAALPERFEELFSLLSTAEESLTDESEELGILFCLSIYIYSAFNTGAARYIRVTSLITATSVLCASRRIFSLRSMPITCASWHIVGYHYIVPVRFEEPHVCATRSTLSASSYPFIPMPPSSTGAPGHSCQFAMAISSLAPR